MGLDRFITFGPTPEWGPPTIEKLAAVLRDFLGPTWVVVLDRPWIGCCHEEEVQSFHLLSECPDKLELSLEMAKIPRQFEVFFNATQCSVVTRQADAYTGALADAFAKIVARWWNGTAKCDGRVMQ